MESKPKPSLLKIISYIVLGVLFLSILGIFFMDGFMKQLSRVVGLLSLLFWIIVFIGIKIPVLSKKPPHVQIILGITVFILIISVVGTMYLLDSGLGVFTAIGFLVLMVWINVFLGYFIWATYFYNLNYGVSQGVWAKIEEEKKKKGEGKPYDPDTLGDEPLYNPYGDQTFGLPPGTVRGMIAFSLLFGGTALLLVNFGVESELEANSIFRDQFEFFKTAFLMMVAFYFGSRSLKYLTDSKETDTDQKHTPNAQKKGEESRSLPDPPKDPNAGGGSSSGDAPNPVPGDVVLIDSTDPTGDKRVKPGTEQPIIPIDPMAKPSDS